MYDDTVSPWSYDRLETVCRFRAVSGGIIYRSKLPFFSPLPFSHYLPNNERAEGGENARENPNQRVNEYFSVIYDCTRYDESFCRFAYCRRNFYDFDKTSVVANTPYRRRRRVWLIRSRKAYAVFWKTRVACLPIGRYLTLRELVNELYTAL